MVKKATCSLIIILLLLIISVIVYLYLDLDVLLGTKSNNETSKSYSSQLVTYNQNYKLYLADAEYIRYEKMYREKLLDGCINLKNDFETLFDITQDFVSRNPFFKILTPNNVIDNIEQYPFTWNPIYTITCSGNTKERDIKRQFTNVMSNSKFLSMFKFDENRLNEIMGIHNEYVELGSLSSHWTTQSLTNICPLFTRLTFGKYDDGMMNERYIWSSCELTRSILNDNRKEFFIDYIIVSTVADILRKYEPVILGDEQKKIRECENLILTSSKIFMFSFLEKHKLHKFDKKISNFYTAALNTTLKLETNLNPATREKMKNIILLKPWIKQFCDFDALDYVRFYNSDDNFMADDYMLDLYRSRFVCHGSCSENNYFLTQGYFDGDRSIYLSPYFMKMHAVLENATSFTPEEIIYMTLIVGNELCYAMKYYDSETFSQNYNGLRIDKLDEECVEKRKPLARLLLKQYDFEVKDEEFERIYHKVLALVRRTKKKYNLNGANQLHNL